MVKIIENIKKLNLIEIIIILSPIIDILTSFSERFINVSISFGIVIRAGFLAFLIAYTFLKSTWKYKKTSIIYLLCTFIYMGVYAINMYILKGQENVFFEIKEIIKAFFFPISIVCILNYTQTKNISINPKVLFTAIFSYITLLFIPAVFNIGYESYAQDKIGSIGWFFSGNEISNIFAILFVFIVFSYDYIKNKLIYIFLVLYSLFTVMQIGTKIPAIAVLIVILLFLIIKIIRKILEKRKLEKSFIICSIIMLVAFFGILFTSPVVRNYEIYRDYLISTRGIDESEEEGIEEHTQENEIDEIKEEINISEGFELTDEEIETIIHSGRLETLDYINKKYENIGLTNRIIGLGRLDLSDDTQNLCEIDYFDIFYNYGYIGFFIYFIPLIYILFTCIRRIKIKQIICNNFLCCFIITSFIAIFLCAISGHTFVSPAVSLFVSVVLAEMYKEFVTN